MVMKRPRLGLMIYRDLLQSQNLHHDVEGTITMTWEICLRNVRFLFPRFRLQKKGKTKVKNKDKTEMGIKQKKDEGKSSKKEERKYKEGVQKKSCNLYRRMVELKLSKEVPTPTDTT